MQTRPPYMPPLPPVKEPRTYSANLVKSLIAVMCVLIFLLILATATRPTIWGEAIEWIGINIHSFFWH